jgi:hypothetical protein
MHTRFLIGLVVVAVPVMYFSWGEPPWGGLRGADLCWERKWITMPM